ncbi:hypothetical protein PC128_g12778 [Phytophthora cactorum]|nr:hypothetical protein PC128_g12778 [Phytophthora cactorum]
MYATNSLAFDRCCFGAPIWSHEGSFGLLRNSDITLFGFECIHACILPLDVLDKVLDDSRLMLDDL